MTQKFKTERADRCRYITNRIGRRHNEAAISHLFLKENRPTLVEANGA